MYGDIIKPLAKGIKRFDKVDDVIKSLNHLKKQDVLIGIPQKDASRPEEGPNNAELAYFLSHGVRSFSMRAEMQALQDKGKTYSQAEKAYLRSHGSPMWHIPPRPFLEPSIYANRGKIAKQQEKALGAALDGKQQQADAEVQKTGLLGQRFAKEWFTADDNEWEPNAPSTVKRKGSDKPNIDTGEMRNSITYVVRDKNR